MVELYLYSPSGPSWPVMGEPLPLPLYIYVYIYIPNVAPYCTEKSGFRYRVS